tara:strand:- start:1689 stop:3875 length:2187 start_codon:yes stop_codon:yes gene_type:complete
MNGTLFSSDFVVDAEGNERLLEINTDTGFTLDFINNNLSFTDLFSVFSSNNITEVVVIHKEFQREFVNKLRTDLEAFDNSITFTVQKENSESIYPTAVADAANKFILRLAYNENALLDSTYAKNNYNLLKLFYDNSNQGSVTEFYYSGSDGIVNTVQASANSSSLPDYVTKPIQVWNSTNTFYKQNFDTLTGSLDSGDFIQKYHHNTSEEENNSITSYRVFSIAYGSNIDVLFLGMYKQIAILDIPDSLTTGGDGALDTKHYYEFASNYPKFDGQGGISSTAALFLPSGSQIISNLSVGDEISSFYISGSPDADSDAILTDWKHPGNELPSGSYQTSSLVEAVNSLNAKNNLVAKLVMSNDDVIYSSPNTLFLTHVTESNELTYKGASHIYPGYSLMKNDGNGIEVSQSLLEVYDTPQQLYNLDIETNDVYIVSSSGVLVHNCFTAGTSITLANGSLKSIENIKDYEEVLCWSHATEELIPGKVETVSKKLSDRVYTIKHGNEETLVTAEHPFYVVNKNDYVATKNLKEGDIFITDTGSETKVKEIIPPEDNKFTEVYTLSNVSPSHNFFADGVLVHNAKGLPPGGGCCFVAGTEILLANGDTKNIEDIVVGDEVIGWNGEEKINSVVKELKPTILGSRKLYSINDINLQFTDEHPFLTKDGWKALKPEEGTDYKVLSEGDEVNHNDEWVKIESITEFNGQGYDQPVYNFTVGETNSYIANGIIVHNK